MSRGKERREGEKERRRKERRGEDGTGEEEEEKIHLERVSFSCLGHQPRKTEVTELDDAMAADEDVARLEIAMEQVEGVQMAQAL
eukprot:749696-Hanusia_phi.AAC.2